MPDVSPPAVAVAGNLPYPGTEMFGNDAPPQLRKNADGYVGGQIFRLLLAARLFQAEIKYLLHVLFYVFPDIDLDHGFFAVHNFTSRLHLYSVPKRHSGDNNPNK